KLQLTPYREKVIDRIAIGRRDINDVSQKFRSLHMPQELQPKSCSLVRAFDQTGDVGDYKRAFVAVGYYAKMRLQRCKRIIGNFGTRRGYARNQSRLAHIRKAHQTDVGNQLQLELKRSCLARLA